jgi:hypothetical protein
MNIFFLSFNTFEAAIQAIDKHVVKMILESAQMLYTAQWLNENKLDENPYNPYKPVHKNHPDTIWVRSSIHHYNWLCDLALAYCEEYKYRYSSSENPKEHSTEKHLIWLKKNPPVLPNIPFTVPPQCMPDKYKVAYNSDNLLLNQNSCIEAYRNYYIGDKIGFATYTRRSPPEWFAPYLSKI